MGHDRLFKELLTTFFAEFIELFFPKLYQLLDLSQEVVFLDKEIFSDIGLGERREVDLVARVRIWNPRPSQCPPLPNLKVLDFRFASLQLNRLNWKDFVDRPNPVASALMARMKIAHQDRPRVKLQCLRLLATLRLKPAKSALIARFVDSYLRLRGEELKRFEQALETTPEAERQKIMQFTTSWEKQGLKKGCKEGLEAALRVKFGPAAEEALSRLAGCDVAGLRRIKKRLLAGKPLEELF